MFQNELESILAVGEALIIETAIFIIRMDADLLYTSSLAA